MVLKIISCCQLLAALPQDPNCQGNDGTLAEHSSLACGIGPQFRPVRATMLKSREHSVQKSPSDFLGLGTQGRSSLFVQSYLHIFFNKSSVMLQALLFFIQHDYKAVLFDYIPIILLVAIKICSREMTLAVEKHTLRNALSITFTIIISQSLRNFILSTDNGY